MMKQQRMIIGLLILMLFFGINILAQDKDSDPRSFTGGGPDAYVFDSYHINHLPGGFLYPFIIENYASDATFLNESNNGFAMLDNPRVYFEGDSYVQFNWQFNGFNLNSSLNDGSPAIILPISTVTTYRLQGESPLYKDNGMNFVSQLPAKNYSRVMASYVNPDMGGMWMKFMVQPSHPTERADYLNDTRRKMTGSYFLDYQFSRSFSDSHLLLSVNYFDLSRQFNDFNQINTTFEEDGKLLTLHGSYRKKLSGGQYELFALFNRLQRSAFEAEIAAYPQETSDKDRYALMAGFHLQKKNLDLKLSFLHENETLEPNYLNFNKELMDVDGDGLYPFDDKLGKFNSNTVNLNLVIPMRFNSLSLNLYADARYSQIRGEETIHGYNTLSYGGNSYLVLQRNPGSDYSNVNADGRAGLDVALDISKDFTLIGKFFVQYNNLKFDNSDNNLQFFTPGFDVGLLLFKSRRTNLLFSYGRIPYDIRENVNFFLEDQRPGGTYRHWNDSNNDSMYQPGEEGDVFGYTGGNVHYLDPDAEAPIKERFLLYFSTPVSKRFTLDIKALYKTIRNNFRVQFDREYGFYETNNNKEIYFFDQPFTDYYLTNNYLEKEPFYAQFQFRIHGGVKNKWFFSFSFMAHMGMGDTAFGNGPGSNDIGILHESQADPNSWLNGFGRNDGDRGFVAKTYFGFHLTRRLHLGVSLKYRDGDPFAFMNTLSKYQQYVIYYETIKAEDEKGQKGGPREDYIADVSIRLNYKFKLLNRDAIISLSIFNILDFGGELSEYVFSGGTRDSLELQVPRSLRLSLQWML